MSELGDACLLKSRQWRGFPRLAPAVSVCWQVFRFIIPFCISANRPSGAESGSILIRLFILLK